MPSVLNSHVQLRGRIGCICHPIKTAKENLSFHHGQGGRFQHSRCTWWAKGRWFKYDSPHAAAVRPVPLLRGAARPHEVPWLMFGLSSSKKVHVCIRCA